MNSYNNLFSALLFICIGAGGFYLLQKQGYIGGANIICAGDKKTELRTALRKLWADHVIWTRQYIVSALAGLEDAKPALERLLHNQKDLGDAIVPFYGKEAGDKLAALLTDHIVIAGDVVAAAQANDQKKLDESQDKWHKNAEEIAEFLSGANSNWPKDSLVHMFNMHLMLTTQEAVLRLKQEWKPDIGNFDKIFSQALDMADALAQGIAKQFPNKF